jgi:endonuclease/exonuclease/phosphatase family metal-dependent hydrolase
MGASFRLMTANLLNGRAEWPNVASIIDRHRPEIVVVQEMGPDIAPVLAARYPYHHLHPAEDHEGYGMASSYQAVFDTIPLSWRWIVWGRHLIEGRSVLVATTHMRNPVKFPWWTSARLRREQIEAVESWTEREVGDRPAVLAGDMNSSPAWPLYDRLTERWDDVVADAARSAGTKPDPTWGWRPGWPRMLRIDHVLGRGIWAKSTIVEPVRGSDHAAVVVDLELG